MTILTDFAYLHLSLKLKDISPKKHTVILVFFFFSSKLTVNRILIVSIVVNKFFSLLYPSLCNIKI